MKHVLSLLCAMFLACFIMTGCSTDSSDSPDDDSGTPTVTSKLSIDSLADDMRECAPDLASSVISDWANGDNGWSGHVTYGVLKKHFDSTSGSESIYATVLMVDEILEGVAEELPVTALVEEGSTTEEGWAIDYQPVDGNVTLPSIFGGGVVTDFDVMMTFDGTMDSSDYSSLFYYKPAATDGVEKLYYRHNISGENEDGAIFAVRDTLTQDIAVWVASVKSSGAMPAAGSAHVDDDFRCVLYFEGNMTAQSFTFKLKTDAAQGWAFWGGGSVATDASYIAVRGTDAADSATYANDGTGITDDSADTSYVILTFGDMKDSTFDGNGYPKDGTAALIGAESADLAGYITLGDSLCLHAGLTAAQNFAYPESAAELGTLP